MNAYWETKFSFFLQLKQSLVIFEIVVAKINNPCKVKWSFLIKSLDGTPTIVSYLKELVFLYIYNM